MKGYIEEVGGKMPTSTLTVNNNNKKGKNMSDVQKELTNIYADQIKRWAEKIELTKESLSEAPWEVMSEELTKSLAGELAKKSYEVYFPMEKEYVRQDVDYVADELLHLDLTDEEKEEVIDRYMNSDAYGDMKADDITYYIDEVKREGAENA